MQVFEGNQINAAPSKLEIVTEQLLATAKSNNRDAARPMVRHELGNLLQTEHYAGVEEGMRFEKAQASEAVLCGLVAAFHLGQRMDGARFSPSVIGSVTMKAVIALLESLGYTADGKRSGDNAAAQRSI
jgi:hypothetical protein